MAVMVAGGAVDKGTRLTSQPFHSHETGWGALLSTGTAVHPEVGPVPSQGHLGRELAGVWVLDDDFSEGPFPVPSHMCPPFS